MTKKLLISFPFEASIFFCAHLVGHPSIEMHGFSLTLFRVSWSPTVNSGRQVVLVFCGRSFSITLYVAFRPTVPIDFPMPLHGITKTYLGLGIFIQALLSSLSSLLLSSGLRACLGS